MTATYFYPKHQLGLVTNGSKVGSPLPSEIKNAEMHWCFELLSPSILHCSQNPGVSFVCPPSWRKPVIRRTSLAPALDLLNRMGPDKFVSSSLSPAAPIVRTCLVLRITDVLLLQ